jgi:hypothetical protein
MAGTMFFSVKIFCIMLTPKEKKGKKKKEYFVTKACLVFLPKHLVEARTFFQFMWSKD